MCSGRVGSAYSTSGTHRINLVTNTVISREYCVVCSSSIYDSDCPFGIFKHFLWKESSNSDGQQFHQYQQNWKQNMTAHFPDLAQALQ
jgi:hypothetical protein